MAIIRLATVLIALISSSVLAADEFIHHPMAIDNGGRMEFVHAVRTGTLSKEQKVALEARLQGECANPTNPITQGMIETRGPSKCLAFVRNQCACTDCDMPTYCLPPENH
jgi:hypothetical protein